MNQILMMNSRSPRRRFVSLRILLCAVTMLELVDKKTFGFNTESHQEQDSKRFSLFYKVKEGMFKKLLHHRVKQFVLQLVSQLCWTKSIFTLHIKWSQENTSYFIWLVLQHTFDKEQVLYHAGSVWKSKCRNLRRSYFSEKIQSEKLYL